MLPIKIAIAALGSDDHPSSFCRLDHDAKYLLQGVVQVFSDDAACVEAMRREIKDARQPGRMAAQGGGGDRPHT